MTDTGLLNSTGRAVLAIGTVLFCIATIVWLLMYGNQANSLHISALSWSYFLIASILVTLGLAQAIPALTAPKAP